MKKNQNFNWKPISSGNEKLLIILSWVIVVIIVILLSIYFSGEQKSIEVTGGGISSLQEITSDGKRDIREGTMTVSTAVTRSFLDTDSLRTGEVFTIQIGKPGYYIDEQKATNLEKEYKAQGIYATKMMGDFERKLYMVMVGSFKDGASAKKFEEKVREKGFLTQIVKIDEPGRPIPQKVSAGRTGDGSSRQTVSGTARTATSVPERESGQVTSKTDGGITSAGTKTGIVSGPEIASSEGLRVAGSKAGVTDSTEKVQEVMENSSTAELSVETPVDPIAAALSDRIASGKKDVTPDGESARDSVSSDEDDVIVIGEKEPGAGESVETPVDVIKARAGASDAHIQKVGADGVKKENSTTALGLEYEGEFEEEETDSSREDPIKSTIVSKSRMSSPGGGQPVSPEKENVPVMEKKEKRKEDLLPGVAAVAGDAGVAEKTDSKGTFTVQVGTYNQKENAERMLRLLRDGGYREASLETGKKGGKTQYFVRVGNFAEREKAALLLEELKKFSDEIKSPWIVERKGN